MAYLSSFTEFRLGDTDIHCNSQNSNAAASDKAAEEYGIGFKKGNTGLRDKVQATLEEMAADGTAAKISEKWFGKDITTIQ